MMSTDGSLIQGTLDALILKTLTWGPRHGYAIARWIKETSEEAFDIEDRALYLALHRLEERKWVEAEWGLSENNRRAKFYRLTTVGHRQLKTELERLSTYTDALFKVLRATGGAS
jgi:transcriptional regulator